MSTSTAADSAQTVMSHHHVIERHPASVPSPKQPLHSDVPAAKLESSAPSSKAKKSNILKSFYRSGQNSSSSLCRKYGKWHFYLDENKDSLVIPKRWRLLPERMATRTASSSIRSVINDALCRERINIRTEINVSTSGQGSKSQVDTHRDGGTIPLSNFRTASSPKTNRMVEKMPPPQGRSGGVVTTEEKAVATATIDQPEKPATRMEFKLMHEVELESKIVNRINGTEQNVQILRYRMENDVKKPMTDESKFR